MASVNKVTLIGNLGRDPELRSTSSGAQVCALSIATSRQWKDKTSGDRQKETEWHRVVFFDRQAEVAAEYLHKGDSIYVEGRLKTRKYADKDGVERYATEVIAHELKMLTTREESGGKTPSRAPAAAPAPAPRPAQQRPAQQKSAPTGFDDMDDDIPF